MTNAELIKALRYCISDEYVEKGCLICPICASRQGEMKCNSQDDAIKYAADALEELKQIADHYEQTAKGYWKEACEYKAQIPKEGEWIEDDTTYCGADRANYKCSLCGKIGGTWKRGLTQDELPNYCPNCGAKMKTVTDCHTLEEGER